MAVILMLLVLAGFASLGYWRGGLRLGLAVLPLLVASILLWLLAEPVYEITVYFRIGLIWPALSIGLIGLTAGYVGRYFAKKRLSDDIRLADRISGGVVGLLVGLCVFQLGLIYFNVRTAANEGQVATSRTRLARNLNNAVVRWIPGVGAGSNAMTDLMEIAGAPEAVRERAIEDLEIDHLMELPAVQQLVNDPETAADIEAAAAGSLGALYRLQKNDFVLALGEDEAFMEAVGRLSLSEVARAVRDARRPEPADP